MARTKGLSPKVTGPLVAALTAFAVDKIADSATESLVVAAIGVAAAIILPAGEQTEEPGPIKKVLKKKKKKSKDQTIVVPDAPIVEPVVPVVKNPDEELM